MDVWQLETLGLEAAAAFTLPACAFAIWTAVAVLIGCHARQGHRSKRVKPG
jgi:hypothetical protein